MTERQRIPIITRWVKLGAEFYASIIIEDGTKRHLMLYRGTDPERWMLREGKAPLWCQPVPPKGIDHELECTFNAIASTAKKRAKALIEAKYTYPLKTPALTLDDPCPRDRRQGLHRLSDDAMVCTKCGAKR